ncbi:MAG: hypothetical protein N2606_00925 [Candidatus Omnitrophica bacterium]|nr:hypothetical protein [Candidatus Omnitrophota bacterium]
MGRNFFIYILVGGLIGVFSWCIFLYAEKTGQETLISQNPEYLALMKKLELISDNIQKSNKELTSKINQVLENQKKILEELAIVKVRASHR